MGMKGPYDEVVARRRELGVEMERIRVIDSHTGGEPTRVMVSGIPEASGTMAEVCAAWRGRHDAVRSAVVGEPRASDAWVGAALYPPVNPDCAAGVLFFNNVGYLGMCGHGLMGVMVTLAHLGRIQPGLHRIETPVGEVSATLSEGGEVTIRNVPAYRWRAGMEVSLPGGGRVTGDVAWGGNWFFLCADHGRLIEYAHREALREVALALRDALRRQGITGEGGAEIDHIELFASGTPGRSDSRNFVLCPGGAYDRSPCGTGTSAKVACLAADGRLPPGAVWRQEGITGSVFEAMYEQDGERLIPLITGTAHITGEGELLLDPRDPFCWGIRDEGAGA